MALRSSGYIDNFAAKSLDKLRILTLRVNYNYIRTRGKNDVFYLSLSCKRLTTAGYTEDKGVAVKQLPTVCNNHIFADYILSVVNSVFVVNVLYLKRYKDRKALCG